MFRSHVSRFAVVCMAISGTCVAAALPVTMLVAGPVTSITADDGTVPPTTTTPPPSQTPGGHGWIG
jgi:hypothetical protein